MEFAEITLRKDQLEGILQEFEGYDSDDPHELPESYLLVVYAEQVKKVRSTLASD